MPFPLGPRRRNLQTAPATSYAARSRCQVASRSRRRAVKGIPGLSRLPPTVGGHGESPGTACRPPMPAPPHRRQPPHLSDSVCASRAAPPTPECLAEVRAALRLTRLLQVPPLPRLCWSPCGSELAAAAAAAGLDRRALRDAWVRERNIDARERHWLAAIHTHLALGLNPKPREGGFRRLTGKPWLPRGGQRRGPSPWELS
ncbi:hypothetical protein HJG60_010376 [Phyllostomus discolor]|uniref:Uncharacterized protein n=1 Tax=Phyllostomus discolor TaxID=89673 RepID=A0A834B2P5_9CHIR|nr:hypothetical protein HJG60_010376 [Phyllostomus discolor]